MELSAGSVLRMMFCMIVLNQCQDGHHYRLLASTAVFGQDLCATTSKYLKISYKCRPNEFRSHEICDGSQLELKCTRSQRLAIYSASYGWSPTAESAGKCDEFSPYSRPCEADCAAYNHVHSHCHGHKRCTLLVIGNTFQSNCAAGTPTVLTVIFTCVSKMILKDIDDEQEHPDPCNAAFEDKEELVDDDMTAPEQGGQDDPDASDNHYGAGLWDNAYSGPTNGDSAYDNDGQSSYMPNPSTNNYNTAATPKPEEKTGGDGHDDVDIGILEPGHGPPMGGFRTGAVQNGVAGFVSDWIFTWNFIKGNLEKFILYITLGVAVGLICVLLVVICRVNQQRSHSKLEVKLNTSELIAKSTAVQHAETSSLLDASDPSDGVVEITNYNQIGSLHHPPISSFTDPDEDETPVSFPTRDHLAGSFEQGAPFNPDLASPTQNSHPASYTGSLSNKQPQKGRGGNGDETFSSSVTRPNHSRQTSFTGSLGRTSQPGMLTGSMNRRDHWTNEYRSDGQHHTLHHYYG